LAGALVRERRSAWIEIAKPFNLAFNN
jgi:hypothetical protein